MYSKYYKILTIKPSLFSLALFFAGILPAEPGTETDGNIVKNSSFEEYDNNSMQPEYWKLQTWRVGASGMVEEQYIRSGDHALLIHMPAVTDKKTYARYMQQVQVKPDTEYICSGWMKNFDYVLTNGSAGCYISVQSRDGKEEFVRMGQRVAQGVRWKKFSKTFRTGSDTKEIIVVCVVSGVSGDTFFDDISITESNNHNN